MICNALLIIINEELGSNKISLLITKPVMAISATQQKDINDATTTDTWSRSPRNRGIWN